MKTYKIGFILMLVIIFSACTKLEFTQEFSSKFPVSGDWTITITQGSDSYGPYFMKIYNTSAPVDSIWIDDNFTFWQTKTKAKVDMTNLTFSGTEEQNEYYDSQVSYANGEVIGKDSIYFEVKFSDDGATENWDGDELTWIYAGHRKVSYEEYNTH